MRHADLASRQDIGCTGRCDCARAWKNAALQSRAASESTQLNCGREPRRSSMTVLTAKCTLEDHLCAGCLRELDGRCNNDLTPTFVPRVGGLAAMLLLVVCSEYRQQGFKTHHCRAAAKLSHCKGLAQYFRIIEWKLYCKISVVSDEMDAQPILRGHTRTEQLNDGVAKQWKQGEVLPFRRVVSNAQDGNDGMHRVDGRRDLNCARVLLDVLDEVVRHLLADDPAIWRRVFARLNHNAFGVDNQRSANAPVLESLSNLDSGGVLVFHEISYLRAEIGALRIGTCVFHAMADTIPRLCRTLRLRIGRHSGHHCNVSANIWNGVRDGNGITVRHQWNAHPTASWSSIGGMRPAIPGRTWVTSQAWKTPPCVGSCLSLS